MGLQFESHQWYRYFSFSNKIKMVILEKQLIYRYVYHECIVQYVAAVASPAIEGYLQPLKRFDFLWQQDLHASYQRFLDTRPQQSECSVHIENFMEVEEKIGQFQEVFVVGPLQLSTRPVKNSFRSLALAWKYEFASFLHQQAKVSFYQVVSKYGTLIPLCVFNIYMHNFCPCR